MKKYLFPINKSTIAFIFLGAMLNIMGRAVIANYSLPFYMDSLGTFLVAILQGPIAGSITGIFSNLIISIFVPETAIYALVSIVMAFVAGTNLYGNNHIDDSYRVVSTSVQSAIYGSLISLPVNFLFQGGYTGNEWGDAVEEMLLPSISFKPICMLAGLFAINIPDKMLSLIIIVGLIKLFRKYDIRLSIDSDDADEENESSNLVENKDTAKSIKSLFLIITTSIAIGLLCPMTVCAEEAIDFNSDYAYTQYGLENGINSMEINTVAQSGDGYIWIGSYSGLYRYDGISFKKMDIDSRINNVMVLASDKKGRLWIGTNDSGVACYDYETDSIRFFNNNDGLSSNSIRDICCDSEGDIYVSTATHICKIVLEKGQRLDANGYVRRDIPTGTVTDYKDESDIKYVTSLGTINGNQLVGITDQGMIFVMQDGKVLYRKYCDTEGLLYTAVENIGTEYLLAGTTGECIEYIHITESGLETIATYEAGGLKNVNRILYKKKYNGCFLAAGNGIGFINVNGEVQNMSKSYFNLGVCDLHIDKQNNFWFVSDRQGVLKVSENPFININEKIGRENVSANAVYLDKDANVLYIASDTGLIKVDMTNNVEIIDSETEPFNEQRVRHVTKDSKGNLWVSSYGLAALTKIDTQGNIYTYSNENSEVLGNRFRFVLELSDGKILAASSDGVTIIDGDEVVARIGMAEGLEVAVVLDAIEDKAGNIWLGTDGGGVYKLENYKIATHYGKDERLKSEVVLKIVEVENGMIYVCSNGLYYHPDNGVIRSLDYFPYKNIYDVYINEDKAYITSSSGLFVADVNDLLKDTQEYSYSLLNKNRGLTGSLNANSWYAVDGDNIFLCCTEGVVMLNTKNFETFDDHYQIVLNSVTVEGEQIEQVDGVYNIPGGLGAVKFTPAVLNYTISDPIVHVYLDSEEVKDEGKYYRQSTMESIYYTDIPAGDSRLKVRVLDDTGTVVLKEMNFLIHKEEKLYEKLVFEIYLFVIVVIFLVLIAWMISHHQNMAVINEQYEQINEAKEEAERANQTKSKFLAQMSHEIRTPINAVLGMDEMIIRETSEPNIRGYANDIYLAGQTLLSLINDILDSSKIDSGKMEIIPVEYELAHLIHDLVNMINQRAAEKDLKLEVEVDTELPRKLYGDDVRIRQVITNILTNAVKYTERGTVTLRVNGIPFGDQLRLHVEVEDTGIGIKEEDMPKLFAAYQRIEENRNRNIEGTGLGMNITTKLLQMMGSKLQVESVYGQGSKFFFDLEQRIIEHESMGKFDKSTTENYINFDDKEFIAENARILVVDDNDMNRKVFRSLMKPIKAQVSEASGGAEALKMVEWNDYDIIFMDHMMPGMDGIEAMQHIRQMEAKKDIPIFALTANAVTGAREEYISKGFDGFLSKPVSAEKLYETIKEVLPEEMIRPLTKEEKEERHKTSKQMASQAPDDLPSVEGLDWNYAWQHLPDNEMLKDGVKSFYEIIDVQGQKLEKMYEQLVDSNGVAETMDAYRIQVHAMKSGAATVGIVPLAGVAKMLEFAAKDNDLELIKSMHSPFIREWSSYKEKLDGVFGLTNVADKKDRPQADPKMLEKVFEVLKKAVDECDVDMSDKVMSKLKEYTFGEEVDSLLEQLNGAVMDLDGELTENIISDIKSKI